MLSSDYSNVKELLRAPCCNVGVGNWLLVTTLPPEGLLT